MRKLGLSLVMLVFALLGLIQTAQAIEFQPYVGGGLGHVLMNIEVDGVRSDRPDSTFGGYASIGFDYGEYVGGELRIGTTGTASFAVGGINFDTSVDWFLSYLAKLQFPVSEQFKIFTMAGGTTTSVTTTITTPGLLFINTGTNNISQTMTNGSFGAGADFQTGDQWEVGIEVMLYASGFSTLTANLRYSF